MQPVETFWFSCGFKEAAYFLDAATDIIIIILIMITKKEALRAVQLFNVHDIFNACWFMTMRASLLKKLLQDADVIIYSLFAVLWSCWNVATFPPLLLADIFILKHTSSPFILVTVCFFPPSFICDVWRAAGQLQPQLAPLPVMTL